MYIPMTLMVAKETTVAIEEFTWSVLEHITVLQFMADVMFTLKMED